MNPIDPDANDRGLAWPRTMLGQQRTALSLLGGSVLIWRLDYQSQDLLSLATLSLAAALAVWAIYLERSVKTSVRDGRVPTLIAASTLLLVVSVALAALS